MRHGDAFGFGSRMEVVGIQVSGIACEKPNAPVIYTKVDKYVDWIHSKTSKCLFFYITQD